MKKSDATLKAIAFEMLVELESSRLVVVLTPSHYWDCAMRGGMIRTVQEQNCEWYQIFCDLYQKRRRRPRRRRNYSDTRITRRETVRALEKLAGCNGESWRETEYTGRLRDFINSRHAETIAAVRHGHIRIAGALSGGTSQRARLSV